MRTRIDEERCQGNRCCAEECPEVYVVTDGLAAVVEGMEEFPDELLPKVQAAMLACPEGAVLLEP